MIVIAETEAGLLTKAALECVAEGRDLAEALGLPLEVLLPGHKAAGLAGTLAAHGAERVTLIEHEALAHFSADGWLAALETLLAAGEPRLLLAPDSAHSRAWLPRLAARRGWPLLSGCSQVRLDPAGQFEATRPLYNGLQLERLTYPANRPLAASLLPGLRGLGPPRPTSQPEIRRLRPDLEPAAWRDRTRERLPADPATVDISEAERIVAGGLGVGGPEGMELVGRLARALGAAVGGTRVISDRGWLPHERYIGSTGKSVAPKLYLALGISGAGQHTVGMANSETIIAVNLDRTAPIFGLADLGIVGDLRQIGPALLSQLAEEPHD